MGDRCTVRITYKKSDEKKFDEVLKFIPDGTNYPIGIAGLFAEEYYDNPTGIITRHEYGADHAYGDELEAFAKAGLAFYGDHTEGDDYGQFFFAAFGGKLYNAPSHQELDKPLVEIDPDGTINASSLQRAQDYLAAKNSVEEYFKASTNQDAAQPESDPLRAFVQLIADLTKDGEVDDDGEDDSPFMLTNEDAFDTLHRLIDRAREIQSAPAEKPKFNEREIAIILLALHALKYDNNLKNEGITVAEIDSLCERLNCK